MGQNVYDVLKERGYIAQATHEDEIREYLSKPGQTFYVGYDPTADSLHAGHMVQLMIMSYLQKAGHRPICVLGGGTGMIGDPSGRSDLRKVLSSESIQHNVNCFRKQMGLFIDFQDDKALMVNNADWLLPLNYIEFLRDIGSCFSVNRMLTAECYKNRMEHGLTFLEFNYMILQAYDFLHLYRTQNCRLELGGDDQWSNILAGVDLIRRKEQGEAYGLTFQLLTTSDGIKMGKTSKGALWLDGEKCPAYDFYQYWRNVDDRDVIKCLKMLTFISMDEIKAYAQLEGQELNEAKKRLAYEVTALVHGAEKAAQAREQAEQLFGQAKDPSQLPAVELSREILATNLIDFLLAQDIAPSKSELRRLLQQGGISLNDQPITAFDYVLSEFDFPGGELIVRKGKKKFYRFVLK